MLSALYVLVAEEREISLWSHEPTPAPVRMLVPRNKKGPTLASGAFDFTVG